MGLLDILAGTGKGARGGFGGGGMSPLTMALLGLLAYEAVKGFNSVPRPGAPNGAVSGGGLGALLNGLGSGGLGGMGGSLGGGLGSILTGGLGDLLKQFQGAGKGEVAQSWVNMGENKAIAAADLGQVLTPEQITFLTERTGLSREELLAGLAQQLPRVVDNLTPEGRLPTAAEIDKAT